MAEEQVVVTCYQCGNRAPQELVAEHLGQEIYEHLDGERYQENFSYWIYRCLTCSGITLYGDFAEYPKHRSLEERRIYPQGSRLLPPKHMLARQDCVPDRIVKIYEEIWPLRHIAPNAFAGQIRRALELICQDQEAKGRTLYDQLKDLTGRGTFPGSFSEVTDLIRVIGNLGAHVSERDIDFWDAELLDDFFRSVVEYVYISPSKIERMKDRFRLAKADGP